LPMLKALQVAQLLQAMLVLTGAGHVFPAQSASQSSQSRSRALNRYLCDRGRSRGDIAFLASPVTGSGVAIPRFQQLLLLAMEQGKQTAADQARFGWS